MSKDESKVAVVLRGPRTDPSNVRDRQGAAESRWSPEIKTPRNLSSLTFFFWGCWKFSAAFG